MAKLSDWRRCYTYFFQFRFVRPTYKMAHLFFVELFLATKSGILFVVVERFLVNLYRVATTQFSVFLTSQNGWVVPLLKFA